MKIKFFQEALRLTYVAVMVMSVCLAAASVRHADADAAGPLTVQVTLVTSRTPSLGEPIVFHYKVSNNSADEQISFDSGPRQAGWYRLSITNVRGQKTTAPLPNPSLDEILPQGLHQASEISLLPSGTIEGDIVATQALALTRSGDYTLTLRIPLTYFLEPRGAWYPKGRPTGQISMTFTQDYSFALKVMPADQKRLQATAEALSRELQDAKYVGQSKALLAALSSLPASVALPSWQALVLNPATPSSVLSSAIELLGGLRSPGAADLLGQAIFDTTPAVGANEDSMKASARKAVAEMYNLGDEQTKRRLEQVYAEHGASKSDLIGAVTTSNPN